jgi:hypothetical protein
MKTPWKLRDKVEGLFRLNRSYIHTYRHWVATLEPFQGIQLSLMPICGAFLLFVFLFVCLSAFFFLVFLGPCCFNSRWWNLHIWCLRNSLQENLPNLLVLLEFVRFCFRSVDPKCWTWWYPTNFSFQKPGFCNFVGIFNGKDCSEFNRVIRKVRKNTAPEPWVWSYTGWHSTKKTCKRIH